MEQDLNLLIVGTISKKNHLLWFIFGAFRVYLYRVGGVGMVSGVSFGLVWDLFGIGLGLVETLFGVGFGLI